MVKQKDWGRSEVFVPAPTLTPIIRSVRRFIIFRLLTNNKDPSVIFSVVNLDPPKAITVHTTAENLISKTVTGRILASERFTDINTFSQPEKVKPAVFNGVRKEGGELVVTVSPKSLVVLESK
jgi:alpha-L-arabinofuranosidase